MGQKIPPKANRLGIIEHWDSLWYANSRDYSKNLLEDYRIRGFLKFKLYKAGIARILIERKANVVIAHVYAARPGLIIGKGGKDVSAVRDALIRKIGRPIELNVVEENRPELSAQLVAESMALQLERRITFRRVLRQAVTKTLRSGALGVKVMVGGRLGGSEYARTEWTRRGRVPLHTWRSKIDYGFAEAMTVYGKIGVKAWVYLVDIMKGDEQMLPDILQQPTVGEEGSD